MHSEQLKAARALVRWSQEDLAKACGIGIATIRRLEAKPGELGGRHENVMRLRQTLERNGVVFLDDDGQIGCGVRLRYSKFAKE